MCAYVCECECMYECSLAHVHFRSVSLSTLRSRVPSFGQLPQSPLLRSQSYTEPNDHDDNDEQDDISIISKESEEGDCLLVERGCYLGLFTKYGKGINRNLHVLQGLFISLSERERYLYHYILKSL